jgi:hypothetical protein
MKSAPEEQMDSPKEPKTQSTSQIRRSLGGLTDQVAVPAQGIPSGDFPAAQDANSTALSSDSAVVDAPPSSPQILLGRWQNASFVYAWNDGANGGAHGGAAAPRKCQRTTSQRTLQQEMLPSGGARVDRVAPRIATAWTRPSSDVPPAEVDTVLSLPN